MIHIKADWLTRRAKLPPRTLVIEHVHRGGNGQRSEHHAFLKQKPPGCEPGGGGCSGWRPGHGGSGGPPPYQRGGGRLVSGGTEPNGPGRPATMPSGPALGALLPPRGAIFTSLLRKLKPTPSRRTSQIISVGSAPSGEPCFPHQGSPGTGSCVLGCEGPVPESQRDTRSPVPGPGPGLRGHRHQNLGVCPRSRYRRFPSVQRLGRMNCGN